MKDYNLMSLVEIAIDIQSQPNAEKTTFIDLYNKVSEIKGFTEEDKRAHIAQFYTDITASGDFVYCGEDLWDLKKNQKLEAMDSEFYNEHIADESDEDEEEKPRPKKSRSKAKDVQSVEEEENEIEEENEDEAYENIGYEDDYESSEEEEYDGYEKDFDYDPDDDTSSDDEDDSDEEKYNAIMDDYENLYDD